jgi:2-polyprenyl-6-methoxyphenol hydroxylase and related FAD-dependent oxidoreductases
MNGQQHRPVLVVGAGPVGLAAALALKSHGIPAAILEAEHEGRQRPGSRAIYIHRATLELLEEISPGLGLRLTEHGVIWQIKRTFFRGKEVYVRQYPKPEPGTIPAFTSLPQVVIERLFHEACEAAGVEFRWNTRVTEVKSEKDQVTLKAANGEVWTADYVIGCDGARSIVRSGVGIELQGPRSADTFIVVDLKEDESDPLPVERVFHYEHPAMDGRNVLFVPFKGGWRIDLQLLPEDNVEDFAEEAGVRKWLPRVMHPKYADRITWVSTYRFYQVVANSFADANRRVFLAGEAAHLFAPFGARGLNSGVPDVVIGVRGIVKAMNAATEAERAKAVADAAEERRLAALHNRDAAGIALEHIQGSSPYMKLKRELAASLAPLIPRLGRWLDEGPYGPKHGHPLVSTKY